MNRIVRHHGRHQRRGSALIMAIIVSVVITGLIMTMAWMGGMQAEMTTNLRRVDKAFYAAEGGAQRVAWYCKNGKMASITSPLTGTLGGYGYSTSWATVTGQTIRITSTGSLGSVSYTCYQTVSPPVVGVPTVGTPDDFDAGSLNVIGDVATGGNFSGGSNSSITGNLTYAGTATNTGIVSGTVTKGSSTSIDMYALGTKLQSAAGRTYNGSQSNAVFDFTTLAGTNKVIYVNGSVSNPTIIGSGTLYVYGSMSTGTGFGTAAAPVNLVTVGSLSMGNNVTIYGSVYVLGSMSIGHFDLTGVLYSSGGMSRSGNGRSSVTLKSVPWFDPRAASGGGGTGTTTFTSFAGPLP